MHQCHATTVSVDTACIIIIIIIIIAINVTFGSIRFRQVTKIRLITKCFWMECECMPLHQQNCHEAELRLNAETTRKTTGKRKLPSRIFT